METIFKRGPGRPRKADAVATDEAPKEAAPGNLRVKMLKKYFPHGGGKVEKNATALLPADEAIRAIELGIAERADPYHFED